MNNHSFASASGLREINIGPRDRPKLMYVSAKSNPKYKLELIDLLKGIERLFCLMRCLALIVRLFNLWSKKLWCNLSISDRWKMFEGILS